VCFWGGSGRSRGRVRSARKDGASFFLQQKRARQRRHVRLRRKRARCKEGASVCGGSGQLRSKSSTTPPVTRVTGGAGGGRLRENGGKRGLSGGDPPPVKPFARAPQSELAHAPSPPRLPVLSHMRSLVAHASNEPPPKLTLSLLGMVGSPRGTAAAPPATRRASPRPWSRSPTWWSWARWCRALSPRSAAAAAVGNKINKSLSPRALTRTRPRTPNEPPNATCCASGDDHHFHQRCCGGLLPQRPHGHREHVLEPGGDRGELGRLVAE
jgi:hypothetical protein